MVLRGFFSLNSSQPRRGLTENPAVADQYRVAGLWITGAGALSLAMYWLPVSPIIAAAALLAGGIGLLVRSLSRSVVASPGTASTHKAVLDLNGNIRLMNDAWRESSPGNGFVGEGQGIGSNYIQICESQTGPNAEAGNKIAAGIRDILAGNQDIFCVEYSRQSPEQERWFRCQVSPLAGDDQRALVTHLDTTSQIRMCAQVRQLMNENADSHRRESVSAQQVTDLKAALDEHAIVAVYDRDGRILNVNAKYCAISGFAESELTGSAGDLDENSDRWETLQRGEPWKGEVRRQSRTGEPYWLAETVVPFHDAAGGINQFVMIGTDITARKQNERGLTERSEELTRSNTALAEFAYLASHDLQEPLRGVIGCVQLLAKRYGDQLDANAQEWIRHAVMNTERMQALISGLLDLSRIERSAEVPHAVVDTTGLVALTIDALGRAIAESGAQIEIVDTLPMVYGDSRQIGQVFQNLIANSIKFQVADVPPKIRIASAPSPNGFVEFSIRDNGIGIDPRHVDRIFGIFQKLHAPGKFPGAGIGLSIAKRIVERHGGRIWVHTIPQRDCGAELRFTLPAAYPEALKKNSDHRLQGASASV